MQYLVKNGIGYGENGLMVTTGHHKSYYLTEHDDCIKLLNDFRKSRIVEK